MSTHQPPTQQALEDAQERLRAYLPPTPLVHSESLSKRFQKRIWLKLETLQPTSSFKIRPALYGMLCALQDARKQGVITSSSGNFAQAVAYAAQLLDVDAQIVMMSTTSPYKIQRTQERNAEVVLCGDTYESRWETTYRLQEETGRLLLHPYDSPETIAADGTIGLELLEQLDGPFCAVVPVSGGGLLSGIASALKQRRPSCQLIGVQPSANNAMVLSFQDQQRTSVPKVHTIADALTASFPGERTLSIILQSVDALIGVPEDAIQQAVPLLLHQQKVLAEPGGATPIAALLNDQIQTPHEDIVCVLSGANIHPDTLKALL